MQSYLEALCQEKLAKFMRTASHCIQSRHNLFWWRRGRCHNRSNNRLWKIDTVACCCLQSLYIDRCSIRFCVGDTRWHSKKGDTQAWITNKLEIVTSLATQHWNLRIKQQTMEVDAVLLYDLLQNRKCHCEIASASTHTVFLMWIHHEPDRRNRNAPNEHARRFASGVLNTAIENYCSSGAGSAGTSQSVPGTTCLSSPERTWDWLFHFNLESSASCNGNLQWTHTWTESAPLWHLREGKQS